MFSMSRLRLLLALLALWAAGAGSAQPALAAPPPPPPPPPPPAAPPPLAAPARAARSANEFVPPGFAAAPDDGAPGQPAPEVPQVPEVSQDRPPPPPPAQPPPIDPALLAPPPLPPVVAPLAPPALDAPPSAADLCAPPAPLAPRCWKVDLTLEGLWSKIPDPEGTVGLQSFQPDQFRWDGIKLDGEFGGRVTLALAPRPQERVELRVAYLGEFAGDRRQTGVFAFQPPPGVTAVNTATLRTRGELGTAELTYWTDVVSRGRSHWSLGAGVRAIRFEETSRVDTFAVAFVPAFPAGPFVSSATENLFIGGQFGVRWQLDLSRCLHLSMGAKALFGNLTRDVDVADRAIFAGADHAARSSEDELVFGLEAEVTGRWQLNSTFALTGGYSLLFLDNVARAHDVYDFSSSGTSGAVQAVQMTDQLIAHSLFFGISLRF